MGILSKKSPSSSSSSPAEPGTKKIAIEDKVRIMQKFGTGLSDEQIAEQLELEQRRARRLIENEKRVEQAAAEQVRIDEERRKIAQAELGKRIIISVNRQRVKTLDGDGNVLCPECGSNFALATGAVLEIAELVRAHQNPYDLIGRMHIGAKPHGVPCIYTGGPCPHCGAGATILVQLVI